MTKDNGQRNAESPMPNEMAQTPTRSFGFGEFGLLLSFVICHSSFSPILQYNSLYARAGRNPARRCDGVPLFARQSPATGSRSFRRKPRRAAAPSNRAR